MSRIRAKQPNLAKYIAPSRYINPEIFEDYFATESERSILGVKLTDRIRNTILRSKK